MIKEINFFLLRENLYEIILYSVFNSLHYTKQTHPDLNQFHQLSTLVVSNFNDLSPHAKSKADIAWAISSKVSNKSLDFNVRFFLCDIRNKRISILYSFLFCFFFVSLFFLLYKFQRIQVYDYKFYSIVYYSIITRWSLINFAAWSIRSYFHSYWYTDTVFCN